MAQATLDAPLTLDPQQAARIKIRTAEMDLTNRVLILVYDLYDGDGKHLGRRSLVADGAQVQTYLTNQEATLYARLLAKLGVTGTVA